MPDLDLSAPSPASPAPPAAFASPEATQPQATQPQVTQPEGTQPEATALPAVALFLGERLNIQAFETTDPLANDPLVITMGQQGYAVLFPYGAAVLFGLEPVEEAGLVAKINGFVGGAFEEAEIERVELRFDADTVRATNGIIWLQHFSVEQLQLVADILSKSVVLAHYENQIAGIFDQLEPFSKNLQDNTKSDRWSKDLLRQLGRNLAIQHKIVGRVEIIDKPDLLWDSPNLERLYLRLEDEYEIKERHAVLERKLALMTQTAETALELLQHNSSLRVEWYIVALIVIEILLSLYELFLR